MRILSTRSGVFDSILRLLFPSRCIGCNTLLAFSTSRALCTPCACTIKQPQLRCAFCGASSLDGVTCHFCHGSHSLDQLLVATSYEQRIVEKVVKALKYRFVESASIDVAEKLTSLLSEYELSFSGIYLLPVPLHPRRLRWRGFNQAQLIADELSQTTHIPALNDVITRKNNTPPQADIQEREKRMQNIQNAFVCTPDPRLKNATIFLVDDLSTTGSTLEACAKVLKENGARRVIGLVFARGELTISH